MRPRPTNETPFLKSHVLPIATATPIEMTSPAATAEEATPPPPSTTRLILVLTSVYISIFLSALDSTIIATLSAPISTSFHSLRLLSCLASAYHILIANANAACQPLSGRLTDIFSRRTGLLVANGLFAEGNLVCGVVGSEEGILVGRVVVGMGGGCLMSISTFMASDLVP